MPNPRRILVVDYDPTWPLTFAALRAPISEALRDIASTVEHVGSTSVPGLAAKPIVDIDVVLPSRAEIPTAIEKLASLGYVYRGDLGIPEREAFSSPAHLPPHHLYVCVQGSAALANHLTIRDHLRRNSDAMAAYGQLKKQLANQFPTDMERYSAGKTAFLLEVLKKEGFSDADLRAIRNANLEKCMFALIVVANPSANSLSHAMASAAKEVLVTRGYEVAYHDLYVEHFDPVQPTGEVGNVGSSNALVEQHCFELARADLILIFHPNWWGQPPAILKGWVDRVFRLNVAYGYPPGVGFEGVPVGLLRARHAIIVNTSNTPAEREAAVFGDPLETLWKNCVFSLCGVSSVIRRMYAPVSSSTGQQRATWLSEVTALVENVA